MTNILQFRKKEPSLDLTPVESKTWQILASPLTEAETLAALYDVSHQTVRNIKMLKTDRSKKVREIMYEHGVDVNLWEPAPRFTDEEVEHIRQSKEKSRTLAKRYGCAPSTIRMIRTGKTYVR